MMIGSNPFWINRKPLIKEYNNFMVVAISISKRDANLHALGHSFENILVLLSMEKVIHMIKYMMILPKINMIN